MSEEPTFITFVRHGESLSNLARRWEGHGDSPLSDLGKQQASLVGNRLRGGPFTHVFASDLARAVDTARATGLPFETREELREIDVGRWGGLTNEELTVRYRDEVESLKKGEDVPRGGGETYAAFSARVEGALRAVRARLTPGGHALVICHGGFIATALAGALGLGGPQEWALAHASHTSITALSYTSAVTQLHVFNDTLHLLPLGDWPPYLDRSGVVGLICDTFAGNCFGPFAAHYDATEHLSALGADASREAQAEALTARLVELQARHPAARVALAAQAGSIHAWAQRILWRGDRGARALAAPAASSISHVGWAGERLLLRDYGVRALPAG